nr:hypothetical protein [uncultured Mediterranean phage uvMED]
MRKDKITIVFYKDKPMTIKELAKKTGLNGQTLRNRVARAFREGSTISYKGEERATLCKEDLFPVRGAKFAPTDDVVPKHLLTIMNGAFRLCRR